MARSRIKLMIWFQLNNFKTKSMLPKMKNLNYSSNFNNFVTETCAPQNTIIMTDNEDISIGFHYIYLR